MINAKDKKLSDSIMGIPSVAGAVRALLQPVTLGVIKKDQVAGYTQEIPIYTKTLAARQPFTAEKLSIKNEGQRSWKWQMIHCLPEINLKTDDIIIWGGVKYRVVEKFDFTEYGFIQYDAVEDFDKGNE